MSGGWKETSSDWESALCVSTLHDALRESERQRKVVHKALNSAVKANREMEEELKVLRGERKKVSFGCYLSFFAQTRRANF